MRASSQENATRFSKPHGFCIVVKKRDSKVILQIPDLPAWRWLRHMKPHHRTCHVLLFGDGNEISQVTEVHLRQYTQSVWSAKQQGISAASALQIV